MSGTISSPFFLSLICIFAHSLLLPPPPPPLPPPHPPACSVKAFKLNSSRFLSSSVCHFPSCDVFPSKHCQTSRPLLVSFVLDVATLLPFSFFPFFILLPFFSLFLFSLSPSSCSCRSPFLSSTIITSVLKVMSLMDIQLSKESREAHTQTRVYINIVGFDYVFFKLFHFSGISVWLMTHYNCSVFRSVSVTQVLLKACVSR